MMLDLSTPEGYSIASALRGPDAVNQYDEFARCVKAVLTGRIRCLCGVAVSSVTITFQPASVARLQGIINMAREMKCTPCWLMHYLFHAYAALEYMSGDEEAEAELTQLKIFVGELMGVFLDRGEEA